MVKPNKQQAHLENSMEEAAFQQLMRDSIQQASSPIDQQLGEKRHRRSQICAQRHQRRHLADLGQQQPRSSSSGSAAVRSIHVVFNSSDTGKHSS
ncbi:hypothetical protein Dimus_018954, partial [Dionaea muscipula]